MRGSGGRLEDLLNGFFDRSLDVVLLGGDGRVHSALFESLLSCLYARVTGVNELWAVLIDRRRHNRLAATVRVRRRPVLWYCDLLEWLHNEVDHAHRRIHGERERMRRRVDARYRLEDVLVHVS